MSRDNKNKFDNYNIDKLDAIITIAWIADKKTVYVPKKLYKAAKQMLAVRNINNMKIKTY
jgi:hypothetical protein